MGASHNLPLDILRLLFEFSASASFESAQALSLVSKEVQFWTDPHLFQIVQGPGSDSQGDSETCLVDQMCMSDASPRLILARNYVRAVAWELTVRKQSNIEKPLNHFPNLVQICFWRNIFPHQPSHSSPRSECDEITQSYPSLRRVSTCLYGEKNVPRNTFGSPFWMSVTHLQFRYYRPMSSPDSPFQSPLLVNMPSLTHLALLAKGSSSEIDTNLALSRVRDSFPQSLILCLLALREPLDTHGEDWVMVMANTGLKVDRRIIIWSQFSQVHSSDIAVTHDDNFQEWCGVHDGVQTIWDKGEVILKKRQLRIETF